MPDVRRILIVKLSAMGDVLHALPAVTHLRKAAPTAEIDWAVDARFAGRDDGFGGRAGVGILAFEDAVGLMLPLEVNYLLGSASGHYLDPGVGVTLLPHLDVVVTGLGFINQAGTGLDGVAGGPQVQAGQDQENGLGSEKDVLVRAHRDRVKEQHAADRHDAEAEKHPGLQAFHDVCHRHVAECQAGQAQVDNLYQCWDQAEQGVCQSACTDYQTQQCDDCVNQNCAAPLNSCT